jgi:hypothetical protein
VRVAVVVSKAQMQANTASRRRTLEEGYTQTVYMQQVLVSGTVLQSLRVQDMIYTRKGSETGHRLNSTINERVRADGGFSYPPKSRHDVDLSAKRTHARPAGCAACHNGINFHSQSSPHTYHSSRSSLPTTATRSISCFSSI